MLLVFSDPAILGLARLGVASGELPNTAWRNVCGAGLPLFGTDFPYAKTDFQKNLMGGAAKAGCVYDANGTNIHRRLSFQKPCNVSFKLERNLYLSVR